MDNQYEKGATPQADDDAAKQEWERILDEAMNRAAVRAAARQTSASAKSDPWGVNGLLDTGHLPPMERQSRPVSANAEGSRPARAAARPAKASARPAGRAAGGNRRRRKGRGQPPAKRENDRFRRVRRNRLWLLVYLWLTLEFSEILVRANTISSQFWQPGLWLGLLFAVTPALLVFILATSFRPKVNRILVIVYTGVVFLLYASQLIYYRVFDQFYTATSMGNAGQGFGFMDVILRTIGQELFTLILLALPLVFLLVFGRRFFSFKGGASWKSTLFMAVVLVVYHLLTVWIMPLWGSGKMSPTDMYHHQYDMKQSTANLGLATSFRLSVKWRLFGAPKTAGLVLNNDTTQPPETTGAAGETTGATTGESTGETTESVPPATEDYGYNVTDIDLDALIAGEGDADIRQMHQYFESQTPTKKNDKTGMFKGCNLILITAESFSHLGIDPELTPTLYKMQTEGFNFTNFYTPIWGVSTSDGEYVAMTGTIPEAGVWSFEESADNYMPMTMCAQLKELGYCAYAYHNHDYEYYYRHLSHPNLGYIYTGYGNGLEELITGQWPESDVEMIDVTTEDYIHQEPFHAYYMTVSGHLQYNFIGNAMAMKHEDEVADLPYSEAPRAYLATQIELDQAMELLLQRLEEAGVAENTVIVITADHYPYGLTLEEQSELAGHDVDPYFEQYRNACIIYKKGMTPETVDWPCSSLDLLPTLCNLFGLDYDSRLYIGHDMFSDAEPLIIFQDRSWITDKASYNAATGEFTVLTDETLPEDYESTIDDIVYNKFTISALILDLDYWRVLFGQDDSSG